MLPHRAEAGYSCLQSSMLLTMSSACGQTHVTNQYPGCQDATPAAGAQKLNPSTAIANSASGQCPSPYFSSLKCAQCNCGSEQHTETDCGPLSNPSKATNLGDVVELNKYFIQAVAVEDPGTPGPIYEAESGKKLVAVELVVGNVSGTAITVNPLNATLLAGDGFTYRPVLGGRAGQIELVNLNPGERVRGGSGFNIPNAEKAERD